MFAELKSLLEERDVILSLSSVDKEKICVVVQRKPKPNTAKEADKLAPLTITQTVEWLDENFARSLGEYKSVAQSLDDALAAVKAENEEAIKAAKADAAVKLEAAKKAASSKSAGKHVPPAKKTEPAATEPKADEVVSGPSLFDAASTAVAQPAAVTVAATQPNPDESRAEAVVEIPPVNDEKASNAVAEADPTTQKEDEVDSQSATSAA